MTSGLHPSIRGIRIIRIVSTHRRTEVQMKRPTTFTDTPKRCDDDEMHRKITRVILGCGRSRANVYDRFLYAEYTLHVAITHAAKTGPTISAIA